jgi:hypothetical protein
MAISPGLCAAAADDTVMMVSARTAARRRTETLLFVEIGEAKKLVAPDDHWDLVIRYTAFCVLVSFSYTTIH